MLSKGTALTVTQITQGYYSNAIDGVRNEKRSPGGLLGGMWITPLMLIGLTEAD